MAGLCEGGNEPLGFLKVVTEDIDIAILKWFNVSSGGVAIIIRKNIKHHSILLPELNCLEACAIKITSHNLPQFTIISAYKPPKVRLNSQDVVNLFSNTTPTILLGDLNSKHQIWGCRVTTPNRRWKTFPISEENSINIDAPLEPTFYRPNILPDILDIALHKYIQNTSNMRVLHELDSDHCPVLISFDDNPMLRPPPNRLIVGTINWNNFQLNLDDVLQPTSNLKTITDADVAVRTFTDAITSSIRAATVPQDGFISYQRHLSTLSTEDSSLWKETKRILKEPCIIPPLQQECCQYASDNEKCEIFADTFQASFIPNPIKNKGFNEEIEHYPNNYASASLPVNFTSPNEIHSIIQKLPIKKSPGYDLIPTFVLKCLTLANLASLFNALLHLEYFPDTWKHAVIIVIHKPGKPASNPTSYRPISLLSTISKVFEKVLLKRLDTFLLQASILPPLSVWLSSKSFYQSSSASYH
ncbi:hypothetical protein ANN_26278 [Periplaneta americana]|uniref:Endonuclease/exonuclease/phosphatase domain-containing protein n=1 Tax=Periplaneta americana TaxID=6978 RepID=A0ABQ8S603_PERAM|nr:hypothetical protein ANN_26278 [Periplaneta americana]